MGSIWTATVRAICAFPCQSGTSAPPDESINVEEIGGRQVPGKAPGRNKDGVAPQGGPHRPGISGQPGPNGERDAPALGLADRRRRRVEKGPRLDLDEGDRR